MNQDVNLKLLIENVVLSYVQGSLMTPIMHEEIKDLVFFMLIKTQTLDQMNLLLSFLLLVRLPKT